MTGPDKAQSHEKEEKETKKVKLTEPQRGHKDLSKGLIFSFIYP